MSQLGFSDEEFFSYVPNVPCGVESLSRKSALWRREKAFLMYRVELKENRGSVIENLQNGS